MNLTTKGRYAVAAMADLAISGQGKPVPLAEISLRQSITLNYLEQIFMKLRKDNLVRSVRGPGGGYVLGQDARTIKIVQIVDAVEENIHITSCSKLGEDSCNRNTGKCLTHDLWAGLERQIYNYLNDISLHDLCNNNQENKKVKLV